MGTTSEDAGGLVRYLRDAVHLLGHRRLIVPAAAMWAVLTFSNIVLLTNMPVRGELPSAAAIGAIAARLVGLAYVGTALLRVLTRSARPVWRPDGAFWLYLVATLVALAIGALLGNLMGDSRAPLGLLARSVVVAIVMAPFATWMAGMATAVPLGWNPRRFMRRFGAWLLPLLFWSLLIVTPTGLVHALIDFRLIEGVGGLFWPVALLDGTLSLVIVLAALALNAVAYRRVAQG
ncbi:MAG TPA: hypothetical protein VF782_01910 [Allosphingosinicella sp.]|jgi:hypothetical protein